MPWPIILAGLAVAGEAMNIIGNNKAAAARAEAAAREAAVKNAQANEVLDRQQINETIAREQAILLERQYQNAGDSGSEGANIGGVMKMRSDIERNIALQLREAQFKASMLRAGADIDVRLGQEGIDATLYQNIGSGIKTGAGIGSAMGWFNPSSADTKDVTGGGRSPASESARYSYPKEDYSGGNSVGATLLMPRGR